MLPANRLFWWPTTRELGVPKPTGSKDSETAKSSAGSKKSESEEEQSKKQVQELFGELSLKAWPTISADKIGETLKARDHSEDYRSGASGDREEIELQPAVEVQLGKPRQEAKGVRFLSS